MAHYESDAELYEELGAIFRNLLGNTQRLDQLRQADAIVQYAFEDPAARVTFDVRAGRQARVDLGETKLRPDIVLAMAADTGRALLTGELNPMLAFARGEVRAKGHAGKILRLVPATVGAHEVEADAPLPEAPADAEAPSAEETPAASEETPAAEETPAEVAEEPAES